jgi:hypothetical protein
MAFSKETIELMRQVTLELRGLREDMQEQGLLAPAPSPKPQLRVVEQNDEKP